jgi:hypothetical protein
MWNDVNLADDNAGCNSVGSGSRSIYLSQLVLLPWFLNFSTVILFLFDDSLNWKFDLEKSQQFQNGLALFLEIPNVFLLVYAHDNMWVLHDNILHHVSYIDFGIDVVEVVGASFSGRRKGRR